ncbi:hypothetical protein DKL61_06305 [Gammaproteobacteria bacterium ESL0073]|nr:hypothetical protein DKL61_06305 [Gammaproteobacteria bacterium ESL0073]
MPNHQSFIDKLINTFKRDIFEAPSAAKRQVGDIQANKMAAKEKVVLAMHELKDYYPAHARQRKNIYHYLNKKLDVDVHIYDYDETGENTLLSLDPNGLQKDEYNYIIEKFTTSLLEKESNHS